MSEPVETGQGEGGEVLYDEMYGEILARIRNPDQYAGQPHRYRAVWQAVAVTSYVAALVAQEYERGRADGAAEERERIAAALEAEADSTFNQTRAVNWRRAALMARRSS